MAERAYHQTFVQFETLCQHFEFLGGEAMGLISQDQMSIRIDDRPFLVTVALPDGTLRGRLGFTAWEVLDAALHPAPKREEGARRMYFQRRRRICQVPARWFLEARGIRDSGDRERYLPSVKANPDGTAKREPVEAYLGWPAYLAATARPESSCLNCGGRMPSGRDYCGLADCRRERARKRKQEQRARR